MTKNRLHSLYTLLLAAFVIPVLLFASGCSPTTEGETKSWERHNKNAQEYATKWPGFKTVIEGEITGAKKVWDEAAGISDKEAKAAKMKEANEQLGKLVNRLGEVKYKAEGIEETIAKINKLKLSKTKDRTRSSKTDELHKILNGVNDAMTAAAPADKAAAMALLDDQVSTLISAQGKADRAYKSLGGGAKKSKKKRKSKKRK